MEEKQTWITEVYQEFWDKADNLADKETGGERGLAVTNTLRKERRDKHLDAMVNMFMATMIAPEDADDEDCEGDESDSCEECDQLPECRERWAIEARLN